jgi:type IV secretory pathway TraG/TraD family ATPase VirD4
MSSVDKIAFLIEKNVSSSPSLTLPRIATSAKKIYLSSNMKDSERVQPITRLFIELAAVELLSDKPNSDQKVLILADFMIFSLATFSDGFIAN